MIGGSLVSSLHKVRLEDNLGEHNTHAKKLQADRQADRAFFVFGDLNIKVPGHFRLKFSLFEMHKRYVQLANVENPLINFRDNGDFHVVQLGSIFTETFKGSQHHSYYLPS